MLKLPFSLLAVGVVFLSGVGRFVVEMGRREANGCAGDDHLMIAKKLTHNPAPSLLDEPVRVNGIAQAGICADLRFSAQLN